MGVALPELQVSFLIDFDVPLLSFSNINILQLFIYHGVKMQTDEKTFFCLKVWIRLVLCG